MKVYVCTEAKLLQENKYLTVKSSKKKAEKYLRELYPYMRKDNENGPKTVYSSQSDMTKPEARILMIHEEELD